MNAPIIIGKATLWNVNCMTYMATLPDKAFSLAICDPPYGMKELGEQTGGKKGIFENRAYKNGCIDEWDCAPLPEYFVELMRVSSNQIIWGGNHFVLPPTRGIICWDKVQPWETFSAWEMAWTSFDGVAKLFKFDNRTGGKIHPTQKPVKLYEWLLTNYAKPGQRILDTHLGSMSSVIAANNLGFELTGCELDPDYFKAGCERAMQATAQERMFP